MHTMEEAFGFPSEAFARADIFDPQTPAHRTFATTEVRHEPDRNPLRAITDPKGSAIFWIAAAAILGLILVTGQVRVEAALGARGGRR